MKIDHPVSHVTVQNSTGGSALIVLFGALTILKLTGLIELSWFWIFGVLWMPVAVVLAVMLVVMLCVMLYEWRKEERAKARRAALKERSR